MGERKGKKGRMVSTYTTEQRNSRKRCSHFDEILPFCLKQLKYRPKGPSVFLRSALGIKVLFALPSCINFKAMRYHVISG